jgi:hypothetical protein
MNGVVHGRVSESLGVNGGVHGRGFESLYLGVNGAA